MEEFDLVNRQILLQRIAEKLIDHIDPAAMLQKILQQAVEMLDAASGALSLLDDENPDCLCISYGVGIDAGRLGIRIPKTAGLIGEVWRSGEIRIVHGYHDWDKRIPDQRLDQVTTVLAAPVKLGCEMVGVIQLAWQDKETAVLPEEKFIFEQFSRLAAVAMENLVLQRRLREEKAIVNTLFDGMPGLLYMLDAEGRLIRWNRKLEEVSGFSGKELEHKDCLEFFCSDDREKICHANATALRIGHAEVESAVCLRDGGRPIYFFAATALQIRGEAFLAGIGVDITQRKEMENELRLHREKLEIIVGERTADLSAANQELIALNEEMTAMNEELTAMNEELQSANELLSDEVRLRLEKEMQLLAREKQYRAATRLLTQSVGESDDPLTMILKDALQLVGAPAGYIGFLDEEKQVIERRYSQGPIPFEQMAPQPADTGMIGQVFRENRNVQVSDYRQYAGRMSDPRLERITTIAMAPLKLGNHIRGMLAVHWLDEVHLLSPDDVEMLQQYSHLASVFLERMEVQKEIRQLAYIDSLTGMANRASLHSWLEQELAQARQNSKSGVLFYLDLDELKVVNDTFGHSVGDVLIRTAGRHIRESFDEKAFCARIGGDEFVVALSGEASRRRATEYADRVLTALGKDCETGNERFPMSASVGIVLYPDHGSTPDEVLKNADIAMYAAKAGGRNCWRMYDPCMQQDAYETMRMTNSLRRALEHDEFTLQYQPKVRLSDRKVEGFEALLRWSGAEYGPVPPDKFIPLAEKAGIIEGIGEWVLREACGFARRLNEAGWRGIHVAVNLSPRQLAAADFIAKVEGILKETGIEPRQLELEVTENVLIDSMEESIRKLAGLRALGVEVALDDFGTGYSSLTYLRRLPVSILKIDKSFNDGILEDPEQAEYVGFIIDLAHALHLRVVAEGVEIPAQIDKLQEMDCDAIQGFVFSRPLPEAAAVGLLAAPR